MIVLALGAEADLAVLHMLGTAGSEADRLLQELAILAFARRSELESRLERKLMGARLVVRPLQFELPGTVVAAIFLRPGHFRRNILLLAVDIFYDSQSLEQGRGLLHADFYRATGRTRPLRRLRAFIGRIGSRPQAI